MRTLGGEVIRGRWGRSSIGSSPTKPLAADSVAVLECCTHANPVAQGLVWSFLPETRWGHGTGLQRSDRAGSRTFNLRDPVAGA